MAVIEPTVDKLNEPTVMLQIRNVAKAVDKNLNAVNDEMADIQNQIGQMEDTSARVDALEDDMQTAQQAITEIQQKDTEQDTAIQDNENGLVTGTELSYANGQLTLKLTREVGELSDVVDVPFFKTVTLIPTSTERAFKLQFTMWDDSIYDTNEFVIPAGGGTDVSVTGVTVEDGNDDNSFKVSIQLSDGTPIDSNDYPFPTQTESPYPTSLTGVVGSDGNITITIGLSNSQNVKGTIAMSYFASANDISDLQKQITELKLTSSGNIMSINGTNANIINSITGEVVDNKLKLTINGFVGSDIPFEIEGNGVANSLEFGTIAIVGGTVLASNIDNSDISEAICNYRRNLRTTSKMKIPDTNKRNFFYIGSVHYSYYTQYGTLDKEDKDIPTLMMQSNKYYTLQEGISFPEEVKKYSNDNGITTITDYYIKTENCWIFANGYYNDFENVVCIVHCTPNGNYIKINKNIYFSSDTTQIDITSNPVNIENTIISYSETEPTW